MKAPLKRRGAAASSAPTPNHPAIGLSQTPGVWRNRACALAKAATIFGIGLRQMANLGLALIVCGAAFLRSELIFLLPTERITSERSFDKNVDEIGDYLCQMRRERGDLS